MDIGGPMISRVAGVCFWMSRYLERVENTARVLTANHTYMLDGAPPIKDAWWSVVCVMGVDKTFEEIYSPEDRYKEEIVQHFLVWDEKNPVSILNSLENARDNAKSIRDTINSELWNAVNRFYLWLTSQEAQLLYKKNKYEFYDSIRERCHIYQGVLQNTIPRTNPFEFMQLGCFLERVSQTARILDIHYHSGSNKSALEDETAQEIAHWLNLLEFCAAHEVFMMCEHTDLVGSAIAKFLILNNSFPRSILYCLQKSLEGLTHIQHSTHSQVGNNTKYKLEALIHQLRNTTIEAIIKKGLHKTLCDIMENTDILCDTLFNEFFEMPVSAAAMERYTLEGQQQ